VFGCLPQKLGQGSGHVAGEDEAGYRLLTLATPRYLTGDGCFIMAK
jgi:hypothetical protein